MFGFFYDDFAGTPVFGSTSDLVVEDVFSFELFRFSTVEPWTVDRIKTLLAELSDTQEFQSGAQAFIGDWFIATTEY